MTPCISPSWSIRRTDGTRISSFTRGPSRVGGAGMGPLGMVVSFGGYRRFSFAQSGRRFQALFSPAEIGRHRLGRKAGHGLGERQHLLLLAAEAAQRDGAVLRLLAADDRDHRHMLDAVLADLGVDLVAAEVELRRDPRRVQ